MVDFAFGTVRAAIGWSVSAGGVCPGGSGNATRIATAAIAAAIRSGSLPISRQ
jgi:hypothetical protein